MTDIKELMGKSKNQQFNNGKIDNDCFGQANSCDEQISIYIKQNKDNGTIKNISYEGSNMNFALKGGMEIICQWLIGKNIDEIKKINKLDLFEKVNMNNLNKNKKSAILLGIKALFYCLDDC